MRTGRLRHLITIEKPEEITNGMGQPVIEWAEYTKAWVGIEPIKSENRQIENTGTFAEATHKIVMRYIGGITTTMRLRYQNRIFSILGSPINKDEMNRELEITVKEVFC